jgi:hypothetical protein
VPTHKSSQNLTLPPFPTFHLNPNLAALTAHTTPFQKGELFLGLLKKILGLTLYFDQLHLSKSYPLHYNISEPKLLISKDSNLQDLGYLAPQIPFSVPMIANSKGGTCDHSPHHFRRNSPSEN